MEDLDKYQLDLDQLEEVTGGTSPNYPFKNNTNIKIPGTDIPRHGAVFAKNNSVLGNMQGSLIGNTKVTPAGIQGTTTANKCPYCQIEMKYIVEEERYECTNCGYIKGANQQI